MIRGVALAGVLLCLVPTDKGPTVSVPVPQSAINAAIGSKMPVRFGDSALGGTVRSVEMTGVAEGRALFFGSGSVEIGQSKSDFSFAGTSGMTWKDGKAYLLDPLLTDVSAASLGSASIGSSPSVLASVMRSVIMERAGDASARRPVFDPGTKPFPIRVLATGVTDVSVSGDGVRSALSVTRFAGVLTVLMALTFLMASGLAHIVRRPFHGGRHE